MDRERLNLRHFRPALAFLIIGLSFCLHATPVALADGWHNAALATSTLDQWLNQLGAGAELKQAIAKGATGAELKQGQSVQELKERAKQAAGTKPAAGAARAGGKINSQLTPQQQALLGKRANDLMEILACMDPNNIVPGEFPAFKNELIPKYRETTKAMLRMMGPTGGSTVANQLSSELMGMSPTQRYGIPPHPDYYKELLALLKEQAANGNLTFDDMNSLQQAAAGAKNNPQTAALANEIVKLLSDLENVDIPILLAWADQVADNSRKRMFYGKVRARLPKAPLPDLLAVMASDADSTVKDTASRVLASRWKTAGELELLQALDTIDDAAAQKTAAAELAGRSPKYADIKGDLPAIWELARSNKREAADAAKAQLENAFLRAPIAECLAWLGQVDAEQAKLIGRQLDDRLQRADDARRATYKDAALAVLPDKAAKPGSRQGSLDLLVKLQDKTAAGPLIDMLTQLPREMWPKAGALLKDLTGQSYGPVAGDGVPELTVAMKKWRAWQKEQK